MASHRCLGSRGMLIACVGGVALAALLLVAPPGASALVCSGCTEMPLTAVAVAARLPAWEPTGDRILYTRYQDYYFKGVFETLATNNTPVETTRVVPPNFDGDFPCALAWGPGGVALVGDSAGLSAEYFSFTVPTGGNSIVRSAKDGSDANFTVKLKGGYTTGGSFGVNTEQSEMVRVSRDGSTVLIRWSSQVNTTNYNRTTKIFTGPYASMTGQFISNATVADWEHQPGVVKHLEYPAHYLEFPYSYGASFLPGNAQFLISDGVGFSVQLYNTDGSLFEGGAPYKVVKAGNPSTAIYRYPEVSPDGKHFVANKQTISASTSGLFMYDIDGSNERPLMTGDLAINWPSFSPDGSAVAYERGGRVYRLTGVNAFDDCNGNKIPDICDLPGWDSAPLSPICAYTCTHPVGNPVACGRIGDCDSNGVPDTCQPDGDHDGTPDVCEGPSVQFSAAASSGLESLSPAQLTVTLSEPWGETVTVEYASADDTATAPSDYRAVSGTLTFAPGETEKTIAVPIANDAVYEPDETFMVTLSNPTVAMVGANGSHTRMILNDDNAGVLRLSSATYSVSEAGPTAKITVLRTGSSLGEVSVHYATSNGTATAPGDYETKTDTLVWPSGNSTGTIFTVPIVNDLFDESNETFTVSLSSPDGGAVLGSPSAATVTILDNDPTPTVQFAFAASSRAEAVTPAEIEVVLSAPSNQTVTVKYATANGTASAPGDYAATAGTLTFRPGVTSQTISVPIVDDRAVEPSETFRVALSAPVNAVAGARMAHTRTITNDDFRGTILLSAATYAVGESGVEVTLTATRSGGDCGAVGVSYATANGMALAGADYTSASGALSWADRDMVDKTFTVAILNDALDEEEQESFSVKLSAPTGGATLGFRAGATVTIADDDPLPELHFARAASEGAESTTPAAIEVRLTAASGRKVTVGYATEAGTALSPKDYTTKAGTLTFAPGQTSATFGVPIVNDNVAEDPPRESFTVKLLSSPGPVNAELGAPAAHTCTILDEDLAGAIKLSAAAYSAAEGGTVRITAMRIGGGVGEVGVHFTTSGATADGSDYEGKKGDLLWAGGDKANKTITVQTLQDPFDEANETFTATLSDPTGGAVLGSPGAATVTILDNDPTPIVQFVSAASSGEEGPAPAEIDVVLSAPSNQTVTVKYATANGTAAAPGDYETKTGTLTFNPGEISKTISVPIINERVVEPNETFRVTLSAPVNAVAGARRLHTRTIVNDDFHGSIQLSAATYAVGESGTTVRITATRGGGDCGPVGVSFATANGTALAGGDYEDLAGAMSWEDGDAGERSVVATILDDALDEADETFGFKLSAPMGGATLGAPGSATVTIVDDDLPPEVRFTREESGGAESATPAVIAVTLSAASGRTVTVGYATAPDTAAPVSDYTTKTGTLRFAPGQTSATISVPIINNAIPETPAAETFTVTLAVTGSSNAELGDYSVHTYTIHDDDLHGAIKLSAAQYTVGEGAAARITVQRVGGKSGEVSARVAVAGVSAGGGDDYTVNIRSTTLVWGGNDLAPQYFTVETFNDTLDEENETVSVTLSDPTGGVVLGAPAAATVTITDNDPTPTVQFETSSSSGVESPGEVLFKVVLSAASGREVRVKYATANGTAMAGSDYLAASGTLTFSPGETGRDIPVQIIGNLQSEPAETFRIALSAPANATLGARATHTRTITK